MGRIMKAEWVTSGAPWFHPYKVKNCLCFDGKRRTVRLKLQASTYFSWDGRATINGKTMRGFVCAIDSRKADDGVFDYEFRIFVSEWERIGVKRPKGA